MIERVPSRAKARTLPAQLQRAASQLAASELPRHVAIIMDGNRRWAHERGLPTVEGHRRGGDVLHEICATSGELGIEYLTVFAFSEENWRREPSEIRVLMDLVRWFARKEARELKRNNVRVHLLGRRDRLPQTTAAALDELVRGTERCTGLQLNLAIDYGARAELCDAIRTLVQEVARGTISPGALDEDAISRYLYTAGIPDPDLLIRTGGELRLSNFLLYQVAYTELWSTPIYWPDFSTNAYLDALSSFSLRERRFGA
ncbi:MAG: di-trans,poly-cis-decaprenylcistransferase [Candidatus Eremiobacteraeota bacterium]|nr:di-trans,poly-cis-decaprenylcistransferase [Candidatus Eremiobacteraeota bacterium]